VNPGVAAALSFMKNYQQGQKKGGPSLTKK
jgi:hypothetical protein